jgi:hypothetical protein
MARAQHAKPSMMVFYQLGLPIPLAPLEFGVLHACNSGLVVNRGNNETATAVMLHDMSGHTSATMRKAKCTAVLFKKK